MAHDRITALGERHGLSDEAIERFKELFEMLQGIAGGPRSDMLADPEMRATMLTDPVDLEVSVTVVDEPAPDESVSDVITEETSRFEVGGHVDPTERYEDLGLIETGGMGEVRRVRDRELNRTMAMKIIRVEMLDRPKVLARFIEEAQATAQLQHPCIVPVHEVGRLSDGRLYFTMKEVRGRTLAHVINEVHDASPDEAWEVSPTGWTFRRLVASLLRVCEAVAYAHERGVVHRDLKPDNIMVGEHGEVLLMDWGVAKVMGRQDLAAEAGDLDPVRTNRSQDDSHATRMGLVAGTPAYMSPEQAGGE
ncbi:MAG: serine/threonine-protein kinase, partial [Myxococcota bacterium]|nr:serine/threonine-protein kinase [Myxococcota bacterium]